MSGLAIDLQEIPTGIDQLDATDPVDRQLQVSYNMSASIAAAIRLIRAGGANNYLMPKHVASVDRATYEATIDNANSALVDLIAALKSSVTLT